jgi:hypothetical protein
LRGISLLFSRGTAQPIPATTIKASQRLTCRRSLCIALHLPPMRQSSKWITNQILRRYRPLKAPCISD